MMVVIMIHLHFQWISTEKLMREGNSFNILVHTSKLSLSSRVSPSVSHNELVTEWKLWVSIKYSLFPNTFEQSHGYKAVMHTYSLDLDVDLIGTSTERNVVINSGKRFPWIDVLWGSFMALFLVATINSAVDFQGYVRVKIGMW